MTATREQWARGVAPTWLSNVDHTGACKHLPVARLMPLISTGSMECDHCGRIVNIETLTRKAAA